MKKEPVAKIPESDKIKHPKAFMVYHVALQTMKFGSIASLMASPALFYFKKIPIVKTMDVGGKVLMLFSIPIFFSKAKDFGEDEFDDRAFRAYHNKMVSGSDKFALGGVLLSMPLMYLTKKRLTGAFELGLALGTMSYFVKSKLFDE
eukprot:gene6751-10916_t